MSGIHQKGLKTPRKMAAMAKAAEARMLNWKVYALSKIGTKSGKLTVFALTKPGRHHCFLVQCDCGKQTEVRATYFLTCHRTSCGCAAVERCRKLNFKHGFTNRSVGIRSEYTIWSAMKDRCLNPNSKSFPKYGGRGITICEGWISSFEKFFSDMGTRPSLQYSLERIDNDGPYSPDNCKWATRSEQCRNQRPRLTIHDWFRVFGPFIRTAMGLGPLPFTNSRSGRHLDHAWSRTVKETPSV